MDVKSLLSTSIMGRHRRRLKVSLSVGAIVLVALLVPMVSLALAVDEFPDVPASHPYHDAVADLASRGIISGYTNGNFGPGDPVMRQQFAKMITRTGEYPVSLSDICPFGDVALQMGTDPLYPSRYVAVAAAHGITIGKTATTFDPYAYITRYQVITMVVRAADDLQPGLLAVPPPLWTGTAGWGNDPTHGANAARAEYNGLLAGLDLSALSPYGNMNRGEVAQVLHNLLGKLTPPTTTTTAASTTTTTEVTTTTTSSSTTTTSSSTTTSSTTTTILGGGNGKIAFVSMRPGNAEIYVMDVTMGESSATRLTNNPEIDDWPDWSPNGSKIAFHRYTGANPDVYVMNANGSLQTNLTASASSWDSNPAWSPDGTRIAWDSNQGGGALQIWIMNANGSGQIKLTSTTQLNSDPDWSPDGNRICFETTRDGQREIYVMNADGTSPTRLTFSGNNYSPQWSPDENRIVFGGPGGLWTIRPDGTGLTQITIGSDYNPTWSPDSKWIVFDSTRSGNFDLWLVKADGTGLQQITTNGALDAHASWN